MRGIFLEPFNASLPDPESQANSAFAHSGGVLRQFDRATSKMLRVRKVFAQKECAPLVNAAEVICSRDYGGTVSV